MNEIPQNASNEVPSSAVEKSDPLLNQLNVDPGKSLEEAEKPDEGYKLPQLRKTTPRLAKIRSAENMKLMAQVLGPKGPSSNYGNVKAKGKQETTKIDDECSTSKGDNEDEIAELMLASTTIKKDTLSRKKAKQARELENIKRLVEAEHDNNHEEERASKYAVSFFQKLQSTTVNCDPEVFRSVINLYLSYGDRVTALDQQEMNDLKDCRDKASSSDTSTMSSVASERCKDKYSDEKDELAAELYNEICQKLSPYPELCSDFLLFLTPRQASMVDKSVEYMMLQKMKEFINVAQVYFAKQPSRLVKITQALTSLASDPLCTIESVKDMMSPILKGHPVVMDLFLQVLPDGKPPSSLFAPHMFENLTCPVGPHEKNKIYTEDSAELYENIKLPALAFQDDPYGGENCKCDCHVEATDSKTKTSNEHCTSCGTRFLNGRIYLQTPEGLRPAKITFSGDDEEQMENIARVSLKPAEKVVTIPTVKSRKRNSKSESNEPNAKMSKLSPVKENDESSDKLVSKTKKVAKSPPKLSEQHKKTAVKIEPGVSTTAISSTGKKAVTKSLREKRAERKEQKLSPMQVKPELNIEDYDVQSELNTPIPGPSCDSNINEGYNEDMLTIEKVEIFNESEYENETNNAVGCEGRPWTREEDSLILKKVKEGFNANTFTIISEILGNRSVQEVKNRCDTLFSLLKKMYY